MRNFLTNWKKILNWEAKLIFTKQKNAEQIYKERNKENDVMEENSDDGDEAAEENFPEVKIEELLEDLDLNK